MELEVGVGDPVLPEKQCDSCWRWQSRKTRAWGAERGDQCNSLVSQGGGKEQEKDEDSLRKGEGGHSVFQRKCISLDEEEWGLEIWNKGN